VLGSSVLIIEEWRKWKGVLEKTNETMRFDTYLALSTFLSTTIFRFRAIVDVYLLGTSAFIPKTANL